MMKLNTVILLMSLGLCVALFPSVSADGEHISPVLESLEELNEGELPDELDQIYNQYPWLFEGEVEEEERKRSAPGVMRFGKKSAPGVMRFGKRAAPGVMRFGKKAAPGVMRFGKRAAPGVMRFGKKAAPGVMRFGKRAAPGVMRFGKKSAPGVMRFGKRDGTHNTTYPTQTSSLQ